MIITRSSCSFSDGSIVLNGIADGNIKKTFSCVWWIYVTKLNVIISLDNAGAAAAAGLSLPDVTAEAKYASEMVGTMGVQVLTSGIIVFCFVSGDACLPRYLFPFHHPVQWLMGHATVEFLPLALRHIFFLLKSKADYPLSCLSDTEWDVKLFISTHSNLSVFFRLLLNKH